jgi:hypothetical protein
MTVNFKKSDFKQADYFSNTDCPIARAVRREITSTKDDDVQVGGRTVTVNSQQAPAQVLQIGEVRLNGSLLNSKGLGTRTLSHIHHAIRFKHFKTCTVELMP